MVCLLRAVLFKYFSGEEVTKLYGLNELHLEQPEDVADWSVLLNTIRARVSSGPMLSYCGPNTDHDHEAVCFTMFRENFVPGTQAAYCPQLNMWVQCSP